MAYTVELTKTDEFHV